MTTKITPSVLENTAVVAATHGTAASIPVIVVDAQGRITGVTNTSISIGTSQIGSGTLDDARLPAQGTLTAANYYGNANNIVQVVTDAKGRIKSATNVAIRIETSQIINYPTFQASATLDTSNAANVITGTLSTSRLADSGVVATTYGTAAKVSQVVVDAKGRITGAANVPISIASSAVTGLATSATTDTTIATNIGSGTLNAARLPTSGVSAGTYGSSSAVSAIAVDATGRITSATSTAISISSGAVTGLATVATSGRYDALLAGSGQPTIPTTLPASDVYTWAKAATKPTYAYSEITSPPTIPTNTNQLVNGAGFVTATGSSTDYGGLGSYVIAGSTDFNTVSTTYSAGTTVAGSTLRRAFGNQGGGGGIASNNVALNMWFGAGYAGYPNGSTGAHNYADANLGLSGTWRLMTFAYSSNAYLFHYYIVGLFVRIS